MNTRVKPSRAIDLAFEVGSTYRLDGAPARRAYPPAWKPYGQEAGSERVSPYRFIAREVSGRATLCPPGRRPLWAGVGAETRVHPFLQKAAAR